MEGDSQNSNHSEIQTNRAVTVSPSVKRRVRSTLAASSSDYRAFLASRGYIVKETLGCGSYSKVKLAMDLTGKANLVAIKIVDTGRAPRDYQSKFMPRELAIWPTLRHRHLCALHESFSDRQRVYMVGEYASRGDMLHHIQQCGVLEERQARQWLRQTMDAVHYMHQSGLAHRDLKLENLLLDDGWNIKLCDFGFAKALGRNLSQTYCGSKSYAAPEILRGQPYDPVKADVWAMGVILYIMVTGKMPFDEGKPNKQLLEEMRALDFKWYKYADVSLGCRNAILTMFTWAFPARPHLSELLAVESWLSGENREKTEPRNE